MIAASDALPALAGHTSGNSGANPTEPTLSAMAGVSSPADSGSITVSGGCQGSLDATAAVAVAKCKCEAACVSGVEGDTGEGMGGDDRLAVPGAVEATATSRAQGKGPYTEKARNGILYDAGGD